MLPFLYLFTVSDTVLLHIWFTLRRARHSSAAQFFSALYRPAPSNLDVRHNLSSQVLSVISRLTSCAALLCRACGNLTACVAERYLTLRTGCERHGRKNPLPYPISERSHIGNLRQIRKQGKGRSSKRKENRRCPFLFALRRGYGAVPAAGAATLPPSADGESPPLRFSEKLPARQGRTRLRQFVCPAQPVQKRSRPEPACGSSCAPVSQCRKGAARQGEPACGSSCAPLSRCRKGAARQGRTRLRQFACPAQPVQKRSRPSGSNPPAAVRVPWSPCAEKRKAPQNCFHGAQSMHFYSNRSSVSTSLRAGACGSCAG